MWLLVAIWVMAAVCSAAGGVCCCCWGLERRDVGDVSRHEKFLGSGGVCPGTFPVMRIRGA